MQDGLATGKPGALRHFSDSLPMLLLRAREAVMLRFRAMLREQGITEQQWRVLRALATREAFEIPDLVAATFLLGPSLSRILADLAAERLIDVRPHAGDGRRKLVRLSRRGTALIGKVAPLSEAIYAEITCRIGPERLAQMQAMLREVEDELRPAVPAAPDPKADGVPGHPRRVKLTR